jgi:hypothetical protein
MTLNRPIAERSVDLLKPSGQRVGFRVEFGPIRSVGQDARCRVRFHGWGDSPPDVRGRDSLEAFLQAIGLVHSILDEFVRRGGRVLWPGTTNDYDLGYFVSSPEWRPAEPSGLRQRRVRAAVSKRKSVARRA